MFACKCVSYCTYIYIYIYVYICVCVCVCVFTYACRFTYIYDCVYAYMSIYIYIYIYICVCVCVCVCVYVCVSICLCLHIHYQPNTPPCIYISDLTFIHRVVYIFSLTHIHYLSKVIGTPQIFLLLILTVLFLMKQVKREFKPVKLRLKIDLVSYPARVEGLGKYACALYMHIHIFCPVVSKENFSEGWMILTVPI